MGWVLHLVPRQDFHHVLPLLLSLLPEMVPTFHWSDIVPRLLHLHAGADLGCSAVTIHYQQPQVDLHHVVEALRVGEEIVILPHSQQHLD